MSVNLIVAREDDGGAAAPIPVEEWRALVGKHSDLRLRSEPHIAVNPASGAQIKIQPGEADAEMCVRDQWVSFLRFRRGKLVCEYRAEYESPANPERIKIASVARELGAVISTDADDELLPW